MRAHTFITLAQKKTTKTRHLSITCAGGRMQKQSYFIYIVLTIINVIIVAADESSCQVHEFGRANIAFQGTVLRELGGGKSLKLRIEKVLQDTSGLIPLGLRHIDAELPDIVCHRFFRVGDRVDWVGTRQWVDSQYKLIVRIYEPPRRTGSSPQSGDGALDTMDLCARKSCRFGAVCETWNEADRDRVAVCTCLAAIDLEVRGQCTTSSGNVCATDGNIYPTHCHLMHASCTRQLSLEVVSWTAVNREDCEQQASVIALRQQKESSHFSVREEKAFIPPPPPIPSRKTTSPQTHNELPQQDAGFVKEFSRSTSTFDCSQTTCFLEEVRPVCGSDRVTYLNACLLSWKSCLAQVSNLPQISITSRSYCSSTLPDIEPTFCDWANVCHNAAMCVQPKKPNKGSSETPHAARSICSCENIRCSENSPYNRPVCGDDGNTYKDSCFLKRSACLSQKRIRILQIGECDPCDSVDCPPGSVCGLTEDRRPICRCLYQCSLTNQRPVCANDGRTYPNVCAMKEHACLTEQKLKVLFDHSCTVGKNPCLDHSCSWPGEQCRVDIHGEKSCICPDYCPQIVVPVCGSDGVTYDSSCHLQKMACTTRRHIWVVYAGVCLQPNNECERRGERCVGFEICTRIQSSSRANQLSAPTAGAPHCGCPVCPEDGLGGKVCGNDGRTYRSECHLRATSCHTGQIDLRVMQRGTCDACQNMNCKFYSKCQTDESGEPFCACPTNCLIIGEPICGSNGRIYENECLLKVHACAIQKEITVAESKLCAHCSQPCPMGMKCLGGECVCRENCPKGLEGEVCGTDGRLYPGVCELHRQACLQKTTIRIDGSGVGCRKSALGLDELQADGVMENVCGCNPIGSRNKFCDQNGRCQCHWGVEGMKCDQCAMGYWGISNGKTCISCSCNRFGAVSISQCDAHTGQCKCKPGITGERCSTCPRGEPVTDDGCPLSIEQKHSEPKDALSPNHSQSSADEPGLFFTPSASALFPFDRLIDRSIKIQLNVTPASLNGDLLLLSIPTKFPSKFKFLRLQFTQGHIKASYISNLYLAKIKNVQSLKPVHLGYPLKITFSVDEDEMLDLVVASAKERDAPVDMVERLLLSQEYSQLSNRRYDGLALGCPSSRSVNHQACGFSGCLTALEVDFLEGDHPVQLQLISEGQANSLKWLQAPDSAAKCYAPTLSVLPQKKSTALKKSYSKILKKTFVEAVRLCSKTTNPCLNGGVCTSDHGGIFSGCVCQIGWQGEICEIEATIVPEFNGNAYIRIAGPAGDETQPKRRMRLELIFLRKKEQGVIVAIPPNHADSEFLAIRAESDGCIRIFLRIGDISRFSNLYYYKWLTQHYGPSNRLAVTKVCSIVDSQWHNLTIEKAPRKMLIFLDGEQAAEVKLLPKGFRTTNRELRKALVSFDISKSPVYLGGIPENEGQLLEDVFPVKHSFVGAIQKVVMNGAELVLEGPQPHLVKAADILEHWENTVQWQGAPCGQKFSSCKNESLKRICRPTGREHFCSCSTPRIHLDFIMRLTGGRHTSFDSTAQRAISQKAEQMACERMKVNLAKETKTSNDVQHDVPAETFSGNAPSSDIGAIEARPNEALNLDESLIFQATVNLQGLTVLMYPNMGHFRRSNHESNNFRIHLRTNALNGLLLLMKGDDVAGRKDEFLALAIQSGRPDVYLSLHKRQPEITSVGYSTEKRRLFNLQATTYVSDGQWHTIQLLRSRGRMSIIVDSQMVGGEMLDTDGLLNSDGELWLGGSLLRLPELPEPYQTNFTGCIGSVFIQESPLHLLHSADGIYGPVRPCR